MKRRDLEKLMSDEELRKYGGRLASDKEFWEAVKRDEEEHKAINREYPQRVLQYIRLGFCYSEIDRKLVADDQLWEMAKETPGYR